MNPPTKVLFTCSGVGILNRGIESFFREAFDGLRDDPGLKLTLCKGGGDPLPDEDVLWTLPRTGLPARLLGRCLRRSAYTIEQLSSFPSVVKAIRRERPDVVFYSDANLGFQLFRWRKRVAVPFRLLFSNGGPCHPPFDRTDFVHQVTPHYQQEALDAGESKEKHFLVPYGISVPVPPDGDPARKRELRLQLGLPTGRPVILSVGWIAREHKRMHEVIEAVAGLPEPRPFLQLLGAMDEHSTEVVDLGNRLLGPQNFAARSVAYEYVADYYQAADAFVLASLEEGFGRVYLEALMHGLPVIAHRHPVAEYVLGEEGTFGALQQPGELQNLLLKTLEVAPSEALMQRRWRSVKDRFSWPVLAESYRRMFESCAAPATTTP